MLVHFTQEQDREGFKGERQNYRFMNVPIYVTSAFCHSFSDLDSLQDTIAKSMHSIEEMPGERERIQRFQYKGLTFWAVSNWEEGTEIEDYENPEELAVVFMLPSDY